MSEPDTYRGYTIKIPGILILMMIQSFSAEIIIIIANVLVLTANIILIKT